MTPFEWLAVLYFGAIAVVASRYSSRRGWLYVAGAILLVIVARFAAPWEARAWLPHAYLVLGYWIPAAFTPGINPRFETWLARADERLTSHVQGSRFHIPVPPLDTPNSNARGLWALGAGIFELAYLLCYPLVPVAFAVVFTRGTRADIVRFWVAVLMAGYASYVSLPWTAARPPRKIARDERTRRGVAKLNAHVLGRVSHNMNTFPSGHVAVSLAAALVVCSVSLGWGLALAAMAALIAVAAVYGRYHYLVDVLAGLGVGALTGLVTPGRFSG
jgi:membrane-associated phospholipid phosphatase